MVYIMVVSYIFKYRIYVSMINVYIDVNCYTRAYVIVIYIEYSLVY